MARALCELQLELRSHPTAEDFHPKTPQPRELKRKHESGKKTVIKLETKFLDNENMLSGDANSGTNDGQPEHPQGCASVLLNAGDPSNVCNFSQPRALSDSLMPPHEVGDFPIPEELANLDSKFLAERCRLGYRAQRIISLAKSIVDGTLLLRNLEQVSDGCISASYEELDHKLSGISGFGPFTRANVLMCMGFYNRIPADTETVRHLKTVHQRRCTIQSVEKDIEAIYGKYGQFQFLAYWSELWHYYESRFGNLIEMPASDYQLITASNMKKKVSKRTRR